MLNSRSESPLPRMLDPRKFAQQGIEVDGMVALDKLERIGEMLFSNTGEVRAHLVFGIDEQHILYVTGHVEATVSHVCQRCLGAMPLPLKCDINLAILWQEEDAERLPKAFDPWVVGEGQVDIYQLVEDELLLSLPIISYHNEECVPDSCFSSGEVEVQKVMAAQAEKTNPFQVLDQLKGALKSTAGTDAPEKSASGDKNEFNDLT